MRSKYHECWKFVDWDYITYHTCGIDNDDNYLRVYYRLVKVADTLPDNAIVKVTRIRVFGPFKMHKKSHTDLIQCKVPKKDVYKTSQVLEIAGMGRYS